MDRWPAPSTAWTRFCSPRQSKYSLLHCNWRRKISSLHYSWPCSQIQCASGRIPCWTSNPKKTHQCRNHTNIERDYPTISYVSYLFLMLCTYRFLGFWTVKTEHLRFLVLQRPRAFPWQRVEGNHRNTQFTIQFVTPICHSWTEWREVPWFTSIPSDQKENNHTLSNTWSGFPCIRLYLATSTWRRGQAHPNVNVS